MSKHLRLILEAVIIVLLIVVLSFQLFRKEKMAYVDSAKLLSNYKAMTDARKDFETKSKQWQANIDTLMQDVQRAIHQYEKDAVQGSEKEKKMARELIANKQKQMQDYQRAIQQNAQQEEARLNQEVISQVNSFLMEYGKEHHYKLILVASNGNIAYADAGLDITDDIVNQLNKSYKVPVK
jgi:outer membrane protein